VLDSEKHVDESSLDSSGSQVSCGHI